MMKTLYAIIEGWADKVKPKWHPKEGLFVEKDPQKIANYLIKHSKDKGQAMQRLVFYMNRAGDDCPNKIVLNKVKKLLSESILDSNFDFNLPTDFPDSETFINIMSSKEWSKLWGDQAIMSEPSSTMFQDIYKYFSKFWGKGKQSHKTPILVTYIPNHNQTEAIRIEYAKKPIPGRVPADMYIITKYSHNVAIKRYKNIHRTIGDISNENIKWCWFPIDLVKYLDWLMDTTK